MILPVVIRRQVSGAAVLVSLLDAAHFDLAFTCALSGLLLSPHSQAACFFCDRL